MQGFSSKEHLMKLIDIIQTKRPIEPWTQGEKIPWNDPAFSQRMLENHLAQEHDWASRRREIITRHVDWMDATLQGVPSRILDLGCGPGLYLEQLTAKGHHCTGVDFSPASIEFAEQHARENALCVTYHCRDIRDFQPAQTFDLIMLTFGEFNVFTSQDIQQILSQAKAMLRSGGYLLLEVHTFAEVKRQGMSGTNWESVESGLFSTQPHLLLQENNWDEQRRVATTAYWVIDAQTQRTTCYASSMQAYDEADYLAQFSDAGFTVGKKLTADEWPTGQHFEGKLATFWCQNQD